jgi:hypothetical protein
MGRVTSGSFEAPQEVSVWITKLVGSVYDWKRNVRINRFRNETVREYGSPQPSEITSLSFINEDDIALLLTGTGPFLFDRISGVVGAEHYFIQLMAISGFIEITNRPVSTWYRRFVR